MLFCLCCLTCTDKATLSWIVYFDWSPPISLKNDAQAIMESPLYEIETKPHSESNNNRSLIPMYISKLEVTIAICKEMLHLRIQKQIIEKCRCIQKNTFYAILLLACQLKARRFYLYRMAYTRIRAISNTQVGNQEWWIPMH